MLNAEQSVEIYPVIAEATIKAEQGFADFLEALLKTFGMLTSGCGPIQTFVCRT